MEKIWNASEKQILEAAESKSNKRAVKINRWSEDTAYVTMENGSVIAVYSKDLEKKKEKKWWEYQ